MRYNPTDPLTGPTRQPDELRRLDEQDSSGGISWPMGAAIAATVVAMLVYGYTRPISTTVTAPTISSTTGAAPAPLPKANPLVAPPSPTPSTPAPDNP
jgi:hypothetical protein